MVGPKSSEEIHYLWRDPCHRRSGNREIMADATCLWANRRHILGTQEDMVNMSMVVTMISYSVCMGTALSDALYLHSLFNPHHQPIQQASLHCPNESTKRREIEQFTWGSTQGRAGSHLWTHSLWPRCPVLTSILLISWGNEIWVIALIVAPFAATDYSQGRWEHLVCILLLLFQISLIRHLTKHIQWLVSTEWLRKP